MIIKNGSNMSKRLYPLIILTVSLFFYLISCNQDPTPPYVNCLECYSPAHDSGDVTIKITINGQNNKVPLVIYNDKYDATNPGKVVKVDTVTVSNVTYSLPVDHYYSVKATYKSNGKTIHVVDGEALKNMKVTDVCSSPCWTPYGGQIDVRLKY
jgi:hypothetical protein